VYRVSNISSKRGTNMKMNVRISFLIDADVSVDGPEATYVGDLGSPRVRALNLRSRFRFWATLPQAWLCPSQ
jgi:hypothetical protein